VCEREGEVERQMEPGREEREEREREQGVVCKLVVYKIASSPRSLAYLPAS
jgi:hypothetical protein